MTKPRELYHDDITWVPKSELKAALKLLDEMADDAEKLLNCKNNSFAENNMRISLDRYRKFKEGLE